MKTKVEIIQNIMLMIDELNDYKKQYLEEKIDDAKYGICGTEMSIMALQWVIGEQFIKPTTIEDLRKGSK